MHRRVITILPGHIPRIQFNGEVDLLRTYKKLINNHNSLHSSFEENFKTVRYTVKIFKTITLFIT
jgi:hypothetical protein